MKRLFQIFRQKINNYLERLAASNNKLYGNKRLDCCDMNNKSNKSAQ